MKAQYRTCRGKAPPSCCRKTVLSLKSPTGAFIVPLRFTNAKFFKDKTNREIRAYFEYALEFLKSKQNTQTFISAVVHMDEKTPTCTSVLCP